jgi:hypothetical protein
MNRMAKAALGGLMLAGAAAFAAEPAAAQASFGISFGYDDDYGAPPFSDPCAYYDYYDEPPPWGLPPDYCDYPVYFEPVFFGGTWYRGPIYYRWYGGERLFWLNGGWQRDEWRGPMPRINWSYRGGFEHRGAWGRGGGYDRGRVNDTDRGVVYDRGTYDRGGGRNWPDNNRPNNNQSGNNSWTGNRNTWPGGQTGGRSWSHGGPGHAPSGGGRQGGGNHAWSGGGGHSGPRR